jgi:hypothetical protein
MDRDRREGCIEGGERKWTEGLRSDFCPCLQVNRLGTGTTWPSKNRAPHYLTLHNPALHNLAL